MTPYDPTKDALYTVVCNDGRQCLLDIRQITQLVVQRGEDHVASVWRFNPASGQMERLALAKYGTKLVVVQLTDSHGEEVAKSVLWV